MDDTDSRLILFFKATKSLCNFPTGSLTLFELIENSWNVSPLDTMKIIMNWRDCRNGKGCHESLAALVYIEEVYKEWFQANFKIIPEYGSWLDLIKLWHYVNIESKTLIMDFIIDTLENDINTPDHKSITLLAKWIPSENSRWDRIKQPRFIIELCKNLFCINKVNNDIMSSLRKYVISPLRKRIYIVETKICNNQPIDYKYVPKIAMDKYSKIFINRDTATFKEYLKTIKNKEKTSDILLPHDLVRYYLNGNDKNSIIEEQWQVMRTKYVFTNSVAVCDISGSMIGLPMEISIALGLLCLFDNKVITFSEVPELYYIPDGSLYTQVKHMQDMMWGSNTSLEKVIDLALGLSDKINKIYIFSDMPFNQAFGYNFIKKTDSKIIFWNLRESTRLFPVTAYNNIIILSGFSVSILNSITSEDIGPLHIMLQIIRSSRYDLIVEPENI